MEMLTVENIWQFIEEFNAELPDDPETHVQVYAPKK